MRNRLLPKTAQMLSMLMILSVIFPVLSYAATLGISNAKYDKVTGKVTATVYSDTYAPGNGQVFLNVYGDDLSPWTSVGSATYATNSWKDSVTNVTYFNFDYTVTSGVYNAVYLQAAYQDTVSDQVYVKDSHNYGSGSTCCVVGGGGFGWPSATDGTITVFADGSVSVSDLMSAFEKTKSVVLKLNGDFALIPAAGLVDAAKLDGAMLKVINDNGAYLLPLSAFDLNGLAKNLGVNVSDLNIKVAIKKVTGDTATAVQNAIQSVGGTQLADPVDFSVVAVSKDNKSIDVDFGTTYVARQIKLSDDVDAAVTTGLVFDETGKKVSFVPSTFSKDDGQNVATLLRNSSSVYTVAKFNKSFADVSGHWAQSYIQLLANKLVIDGVTDSTFEPDRNITRAEFAALVVRSLGLNASVTNQTYFNDVSSSDWYAGVVAAASQAGIIDGYEDGTFRPTQQITREELAAMVVRALRYAGVDTKVSDSEQAALLAKFTDASQIIWGEKELAIAVKNGIVDGMTDDTLGSYLQATRAQSATMLKRFLSKAGFIN